MLAEISFDLLMTPDMEFCEGTFRLPGEPWQVFVVLRRDLHQAEIRRQRWDSGVSGLLITFPKSDILDRNVVIRLLSDALGVGDWAEVRGPDSMQLR